MTYDQMLTADNALAEKTLEQLDPVTGTLVLRYLVSGKPITQGVNNLDVSKESSKAGIIGYHGTQHAAYQEGPGLLNMDEDVMIFSKASLQVPDILGAVEEVQVPILKDPPIQSIAHVTLNTFKIDKFQENAPHHTHPMQFIWLSCCRGVRKLLLRGQHQ
jgi:hypothetical protein